MIQSGLKLVLSLLCIVAISAAAHADFISEDIGGPAIAGSTTVITPGVDFDMTAAGADIWGNSDQFQFNHETVSGDFEAVVQVVSLTWTDDPAAVHDWAKAGLMARNGVDAGANHVSVIRAGNPGNGVQLQARPTAGGGSLNASLNATYTHEEPVWVKLSRQGDVFAAWWAADDAGNPGEWLGGNMQWSAMPTDIELGMAVTSHQGDRDVVAQLRNYSVGPLGDFPALTDLVVPGPKGGEGYMGIREVIDNGGIGDQGAAINSLTSGTGTIVDYTAPVFNIKDNGGGGHFGNDAAHQVVTDGLRNLAEVDNIAVAAKGTIRVEEGGKYTFGVNSDDGFTLQFPGKDFTSANNGSIAVYGNGNALQFYGGRGAADTLGVIDLPAGDHEFVLVYHEGGGGSSAEFFAAKGEKTGFDADFMLVGGPAPQTFSVPGLAADALVIASKPGAWTGAENGTLDSVQDGKDALIEGMMNGTNTAGTVASANLGNPGGSWADALPVPGVPDDSDDFAIDIMGAIEIPADGIWEIGFNSDDGGALMVYGKEWIDIVANDTGTAVITEEGELVTDALTGRSFTAGSLELAAGIYSFEAMMFERGGGAHLSVFGRQQGDPNWHVLTVGGAGEYTTQGALQLVPEPSTIAMLLSLAVMGLVGYLRRK